MIRTVVGVAVGFAIFTAVVAGGSGGAFESLGAESVFQSGVYDTTLTWKASTLVIGLLGGLCGGVLSRVVGRHRSALALAGVIGALGAAEILIYANFGAFDSGVRPEAITVEMAILNEQKPMWMLIGNMLASVGGVLCGSMGAGRARRSIGAKCARQRARITDARCCFAHRKRATPGAPPADLGCESAVS